MRALLVVCALLAGCENAVVIEVEVPASVAGATHVELFLGLEDCHVDGARCPGVRPPGVERGVLPGDVYLHADTPSFRSPIESDGVARFKIAGSGTIHYIAAVDNTERAATLVHFARDPSEQANRYRLVLDVASRLVGPKTPTTDGRFVEIWRQDEQDLESPACFGFEQWRDGSLEGRAFIVPRDDKDCDNVLDSDDADCAPLAHGAGDTPPISAASCTLFEPAGMSEVCVLGGLGCNAQGVDDQCVATDYCVPSHYCLDTACKAATAAGVRECLARVDGDLGVGPHVECVFGVEPTPDGDVAPCLNAQRFAWHIGTFGLPCVTPATFEDGQLLLSRTAMPFDFTFQSALKIVTLDENGSSHELAIKIAHDTACDYEVRIEGDAAPNMSANLQLPGFVRLGVTTPEGSVRYLLLPLVLKSFAGCQAAPACTLKGTGDVYACAR